MRNRRKRDAYPKYANEGRSTYLVNLGQKPTWKRSRPNIQPPCTRLSRGGNTRVRLHPCMQALPPPSTWHLLLDLPMRLHGGSCGIFLQTDHSTPINRWECLLLISSYTREKQCDKKNSYTPIFSL